MDIKLDEGDIIEYKNTGSTYTVEELGDDQIKADHMTDEEGNELEDELIVFIEFDRLLDDFTHAGQEFFTMSDVKTGQILQWTDEYREDEEERWGNKFVVVKPFLSVEEYNKKEEDDEITHDTVLDIMDLYDFDMTCEVQEGDHKGELAFFDSDKMEKIPAKKETDEEFMELL